MSEAPGNKHGIVVQPTADGVLVEHRDRIRKLEANQSTKADGVWHYIGAVGEPPFQNGWHNVGYPWTNARFKKQASGFVVVDGEITGGLDGTVAFTLPVGARPGSYQPFVTDLDPIGFAKIRVETDGAVRVVETVPVDVA